MINKMDVLREVGYLLNPSVSGGAFRRFESAKEGVSYNVWLTDYRGNEMSVGENRFVATGASLDEACDKLGEKLLSLLMHERDRSAINWGKAMERLGKAP